MNKRKLANPISLFIVVCTLSISGKLIASQPKPCSAEEYRQFDFWIGDWEVKDVKNNIVGHNKIFPVLEGCALSENWSGASGNPGVSYNFYDRAEKKWHQTWIDQTGTSLYLDGNLVNGSMVLQGYRPNKDVGKVLHQISWTPLDDGRVKQHWRASGDEGKTWKDVFIGFYNKK